MMRLIQGSNSDESRGLLDQMFALRARVFRDRLGWAVNAENGRERDEFDDLDPLYGLAIARDERVVGCFRLLQTTGPTMLGSVFSTLLPEGEVVRSPIVWESTRFCIDSDYAAEVGERGLKSLTTVMLTSLYEIGVHAGLSHIVTVIDVRMERILRRAGCPMVRLGEPKQFGAVKTLAILMPVGEESVAQMHSHNSLEHACIPEEEWLRVHAA